jgi:hypothetical protein
MQTLRALLIQRAARLQQRPAFSTQTWALDYGQLRNRVEGVALGLLSTPQPVGSSVHRPGSDPWAWMAELAAACCGLQWDPKGEPISDQVLGGPGFNSEEGRGPYHDRDHLMDETTLFTAQLTHGELLRRLTRMNVALGWDHETRFHLPDQAMGTPAGRGALWCALYAGAQVRVGPARPSRSWFSRSDDAPFDPEPFLPLGL